MTLAQQLNDMVTSKKMLDNKPPVLNQEALDFILDKCKKAASKVGVPSLKFILDETYELSKGTKLSKLTGFYNCSEVIEALKDPELGLKLHLNRIDNNQMLVEVQWGEPTNNWSIPIAVEVNPPEEYKPFLKELLKTNYLGY